MSAWANSLDRTDTRLKTRNLEEFQTHLGRSAMPWRIAPVANDRTFHGALSALEVDGFTLADIEAGPLSGTRVSAAGMDKRYLCVALMQRGSCWVSHGDHEIVGTDGSVVLWDTATATQMHTCGVTRQKSICIPFERAAARIPFLTEMNGQTFDAGSPLGALLASHLTLLHRVAAALDPAILSRVLLGTMELLTAACMPLAEGRRADGSRRALLTRIQAFILDNLDDPDLSPRSIADQFRISTRYVHLLFRGTGFTAASWIRTRRLEDCRTQVLSGDSNVTQLAMRYGFSDSSTFSRAFRRAFGSPPSSYADSARLHHSVSPALLSAE